MGMKPPAASAWTAAELAKAVSGKVVHGSPEATFASVSTDSRKPMPESLFIALVGENFDGAKFCRQAAEKGSRIVLVRKASWEQGLVGTIPEKTVVVVVEDTLRALGDWACWHRRRFHVPVVAITGSNGKTSTKEMTVSVLGGSEDVLYNHGNLNNLVGMPRALLELGSRHRFVVMEMGMNARGEIRRLAEVAIPKIGLITNVHPVHLEGLGSIQAVAEAKGELFEALPEDGIALVNVDDPYVLRVAGKTRAKIVTFGRNPNAEVRVLDASQGSSGLAFTLSLRGNAVAVRLTRPGVHNAVNAAGAAAIGLVLGVRPEEIARRLENAKLPRLRMEQVDLGHGHLLVDCYNANPRSVQAALQTLSEVAGAGPKMAILGEMKELGESSETLHRQVGQAAAEAGIAELCVFGAQAKAMEEGARERGLTRVVGTESVDEASAWAETRLKAGAWILVKGSRAMRLERVVLATAKRFGVVWEWEHEE
jgi:UDP-N-acetylmuramoyl-tripeptide--D-alanyl-D-alanine ligase